MTLFQHSVILWGMLKSNLHITLRWKQNQLGVIDVDWYAVDQVCCMEGLTLDRLHGKDFPWSSIELYFYPPQSEDYQWNQFCSVSMHLLKPAHICFFCISEFKLFRRFFPFDLCPYFLLPTSPPLFFKLVLYFFIIEVMSNDGGAN